MPASSEPALRTARVREMDPVTLYRLLQLRVDVFVVEQECPYPELDGRDLEPDALLLWFEAAGEVLATVRLLHDGDERRIGRVATSRAARGRGLAADLMREAVRLAGGRTVRLDAQAHLQYWYARFGFAVSGAEFLEDGIPHVPMVGRAADSAAR
ncbi:GNAT family N-acetyltransferase [Microbacterium sp. G2-8]|uniref:GNAT family N-acetyltransferase n=1 Tax=Microbacterium sp. G2-8 TaxID=2842454 RepID=UPI001C8AECA1|nr:GNAT family N-acetyltransferase [Microbacterium sp. G2-8]